MQTRAVLEHTGRWEARIQTGTPFSSSPCLTTTRERVPAATTDTNGTAILSEAAYFG